MPHLWDVIAQRFEAPASGTSTLNPDSTWRIDVASGIINDQLPTILYQRVNDPRGWAMAPTYVELAGGTANSTFVERDVLDDVDDPPFLVVSDPPSVTTARSLRPPSDFVQVPDISRLGLEDGAFCGASDWDLELWRASVILTAAPLTSTLFSAAFPPPRLQRFRLFTTPSLPSANFGASSGGFVELATLYLLRDPKDPLNTAEIRVRQREFYGFWSMILQPGASLVTALNTAAGGGAIASLISGELENELQGAASAEIWTV